MLQDLDISEEYFTGETDLVDDFYKPCLAESVRYDRSVGFFRSSVFVLIGPDLIDFVKRGGKVRLVSSPCLTQEDVEAIAEGYKQKELVVSEALDRDIEQLIGNERLQKNTEALATLITHGALEVKLVFLPEATGEYHAKLGIFYDDHNNIVSFKGSINESWTGWHERGNHETLDVFCSWRESRDNRQVFRNKDYFERLWRGDIRDLEVIPFPEVAREKLKIMAKNSLNNIEPEDVVDYFRLGQKTGKEHLSKENSKANSRTPFEHQLKAISEWKKQGKRGIFEHATGSGKTFTALTALKEHLDPEGVALVLVPDKLLHRQWAAEIKEEINDVSILKAGDGHVKWKKDHRLRDFTSPISGLGKRVVLSTMQTARTPAFLNSLHVGQHLMIVADEVHEIGSKENSKALTIESGARLGLSATPRRYGDPEGTAKILSYFGNIVDPPYTLVDAINDDRLVPYEYYPKPVNLTAEESECWAEETDKISKEYARSKKDSDGNTIISSFLQNLIIQRSRIAKKAAAKTPLALEIIEESYTEGESWLIYCEDQYQLLEIMEVLNKKGFRPLEYHTNMQGDQEAALKYFKEFGGILCSIKCLDQGVDIPKISHAIILASSQNPRQFIQRRGRVLRTSPGKYRAVIFDAIVVPVSLELEPEQLSLLKSEFQRSLQFAKTALNSGAESQLINLAIALDIDPDELGLLETDGVEEIEEDEIDG
ncbi:DEAD/DEAH box helicase family protein [Halieaceae bacterium]|nr:DEAD/DEAH box helicase family protein [Halieaceae bacterium]